MLLETYSAPAPSFSREGDQPQCLSPIQEALRRTHQWGWRRSPSVMVSKDNGNALSYPAAFVDITLIIVPRRLGVQLLTTKTTYFFRCKQGRGFFEQRCQDDRFRLRLRAITVRIR